MFKNNQQNMVEALGANTNQISANSSLPTQNSAAEVARTKQPRIVVRDYQLGCGSQGNKLVFDDKVTVEYRMLSARLRGLGQGYRPKIALGNARINVQKECEFDVTPIKTLSRGIEPTHAYVEIAWSKNSDSVFEEVLPIEKQIAWAGGLDAMYYGRRVGGSHQQTSYAAKHGVDYVVFPLTAIAEDQREILIEEYTELFRVKTAQLEAKTAELQKHRQKITAASGKLQNLLDSDSRRQKKLAEEEAAQRKENLQRLRNSDLSSAVSGMHVFGAAATRRGNLAFS